MAKDLCQILEWDTEFFGLRVARVNANSLTKEQFQVIDTWCRAQDIDILYFLATSHNPQITLLAEANGFHLVDIRLTLEGSASKNTQPSLSCSPDVTVRKATYSDLPVVEAIARKSYRDSRFYYDLGFEEERCDTLYATWIRRSFEGYADVVLVADIKKEPVGYVTGVLDERSGEGEIGLVGVGSNARGCGVGQKLVSKILAWFIERDIDTVRVVTQGRNVPAQRLYQRCGFVTASVQIWYHKWFFNDREETCHDHVSYSL